jgi:hypothetical protein
MAFQIGFDGIASAELTHLLDNLSHNLNARFLLAQVEPASGVASGVITGGGGASTPCSDAKPPHDPDCVHTEFIHDPNTYTGGAIGFFIGLPIGILAGAFLGFGVAKILIKLGNNLTRRG